MPAGKTIIETSVAKSNEIWKECRKRDKPYIVVYKSNSRAMRSWTVDLWAVDVAGLRLKKGPACALDNQLHRLFTDMANDKKVSSWAKKHAYLSTGGTEQWSGRMPVEYVYLMVSSAEPIVSNPWNWEVVRHWEVGGGDRTPEWLQDLQLRFALGEDSAEE